MTKAAAARMNLPSPSGFLGIGDLGNFVDRCNDTESGAETVVDTARTWVIEWKEERTKIFM